MNPEEVKSDVPIINELRTKHPELSIMKFVIYLDKMRLLEEMKRNIISSITTIKTIAEIDFSDIRLTFSSASISHENSRSELLSRISAISDILTRLMSIDMNHPNLDLLSIVITSYKNYIMANLTMSDSDLLTDKLRIVQEKVSLCDRLKQICDLYRNNRVWNEYYMGSLHASFD